MIWRTNCLWAVGILWGLILGSCVESTEEAARQENEDTSGDVAIGVLPGYGSDEIGFRNGADGENDAQGVAPDDSYEDSYSATDGDSDADSDADADGDADYDVDVDTDSGTATQISVAFLDGAMFSAPWFGMHYEGIVASGAENAGSVSADDVYYNATDGEIGEWDFFQDSANSVVWMEENVLRATSPVYSESYVHDEAAIPYRDDVIVESVFDSSTLDANQGVLISQNFPSLVLRNTYQVDEITGDKLRASCAVAGTNPQTVGASGPGDAIVVGPIGDGSTAVEIAMAHKTELTSNLGLVAQQYGDSFRQWLPQLVDATNMCVCYAEDGVTPMSCSELGVMSFENTKAAEDETLENPFYTVTEMSTSTFSLDVDTASYTLVRQAVNNGRLPASESVRIEEMINYFKYNYRIPTGKDPFTVYTELGECPWNPARKLAMIGVRGQQLEMNAQPPANLVYLLDVSGSMSEEMWLLKPAFRLLAQQMRPQDTVSIVTYAGRDAVIIDGANGDEKELLLEAIDALQSGGSTNGEGGINKAYELAEKHFIQGGNNRVILATDGDFNVGISNEDELVSLIKEKAATGTFLTVYGVSTYSSANMQDSKMEQLADNGNGTYFFLDSKEEARRAFSASLSGTLLTIAKDVKLQVQFNPNMVKGFRLIGYDNRALANDDFNNDSVDAGELGNGEDMTAFYELILANSKEAVPPTVSAADANAQEVDDFEPLADGTFMAVRMRYKLPEEEQSTLVIHPVTQLHDVAQPSQKFVFASTLAHLGLVLRQSAYLDNNDTSMMIARVRQAFPGSTSSTVSELVSLIQKANQLLQPDNF